MGARQSSSSGSNKERTPDAAATATGSGSKKKSSSSSSDPKNDPAVEAPTIGGRQSRSFWRDLRRFYWGPYRPQRIQLGETLRSSFSVRKKELTPDAAATGGRKKSSFSSFDPKNDPAVEASTIGGLQRRSVRRGFSEVTSRPQRIQLGQRSFSDRKKEPTPGAAATGGSKKSSSFSFDSKNDTAVEALIIGGHQRRSVRRGFSEVTFRPQRIQLGQSSFSDRKKEPTPDAAATGGSKKSSSSSSDPKNDPAVEAPSIGGSRLSLFSNPLDPNLVGALRSSSLVNAVFLSYGDGDDGRSEEFAYALMSRLEEAEIFVYSQHCVPYREDRERYRRGIMRSRLSIPVFSRDFYLYEDFVTSITLMLLHRRMGHHIIVPIFFGVEPSAVADLPTITEEDQPWYKENINEWRQALQEVANLKGWNIDRHFDTRNVVGPAIHQVVSHVIEILQKGEEHLVIPENITGTDCRVQEVITMLDTESRDVRFVGIWGVEGVGKTTLAKLIYNNLYSQFDACSFIANVKEVCEEAVHYGLAAYWEIFQDKLQHHQHTRSLIVLDDVDSSIQAELIIRHLYMYRPGSRIILTSRYVETILHIKHFVGKARVHTYEVKPMNNDDALQLVSRCVFHRDFPPEELHNLHRAIVSVCGGIPSALISKGSFLHNRDHVSWRVILEAFKVERATNNKELISEIRSLVSAEECEVVLSSSEKDILFPLLKQMMENRIGVFRDDKLVDQGKELHAEFDKAINNSKVYVPVLSKDYASSARCLHELVCMLDSCQKSSEKMIVPIFYEMRPSDLKLDSVLYEEAPEIVHRWEEALKEVAAIQGWELKVNDFEIHCKLVSDGILNKLRVKHVSADTVGMEDRVKVLKEELDIESGGVLFIGIHGVGGLGKTALTKVVFSELCDYFEGSSFLSDIKWRSKGNGLQHLKDKLLKDISGIDSENDRIVKDTFFQKKVLIVLDDVDDREQIEELVGKASRFGSGSRIIVTTQDINVMAIQQEASNDECILKWPAEVCKFPLREMGDEEARVLFCRHAFGEDSPPQDYQNFVQGIMNGSGRLPLVIEVIGSYLNHKRKNVWAATVKRLRTCKGVQEKLKISYDALDDEVKQVFLDIACFFSDQEKTAPIYMWDAFDFPDQKIPNQIIECLVGLSLIKVVEGSKLWMHDQVRDLGQDIVRREKCCSRLWEHEEVLDILSIKEESRVEAVSPCSDLIWDCTITPETFKTLPKLRFLELNGFQFEGDFEHFPSTLRWLSWHFCPSEIKAIGLSLENVVILDLSRSDITDEWGGWNQIGKLIKLKVLNLTSCKGLTNTPDFEGYDALERLILEDCENLVKIGSSIAKLKKLKHLNVKGCTSLDSLPNEIGSAENLMEILVQGNGKSFTLPGSIKDLQSLSILEVACVKISFPAALQTLHLEKLERLSFLRCSAMDALYLCAWYFASLVGLDLSGADFARLPDFIRDLEELKVLRLESSAIEQLPLSIGKLEKLEELNARNCKNLKGPLPKEIGDLSSLQRLDLSFTMISSLPETMNKLPSLLTLHLESCNELQELPALPESLIKLHVESQKLRKLLNLSLSAQDYYLDWRGMLSKLEMLELHIPNISLSKLELDAECQLRSFTLTCKHLKWKPKLPSNLSRLVLKCEGTGTILPGDLCNLKRLTFLELHKCRIEDGMLRKLESVEHFSAYKCEFDNVTGPPDLPQHLRALCLEKCQLGHGLVLLSGLTNLIRLDLKDNPGLTSIQGLEGSRSLEKIIIRNCDSLEVLGDLSDLKDLESLTIVNCPKLREVKGLERIKSLKQLLIYPCNSLEGLSNSS